MDEIIKMDVVSQYNDFMGQPTLHPLVSVIDLSKANLIKPHRHHYGFYAVFLKGESCGAIRYGRNSYDYSNRTMMFTAPGQVVEVLGDGEFFQPYGWALLFHPDLLLGTSLGRNIKEYTFFSYEVFESLHLSEQESEIIIDCLNKIDYEIKRSIDKHSKMLITANIELLLGYCTRFYDRQFITRNNLNKDILVKFESLLNNYFQSDKPQMLGTPTVKFCAEQLNLSPNYFGDLIKKETGKTAQEQIQLKIIEVAKEKIFDTSKTVSEIAYELGYKYPSHFNRLFKTETGYTPNEYRSLN